MYTNIDQFTNKRDDLFMAITEQEPDLILLTEVIPKAQVNPISPATLSLPGFRMYLNFQPGNDNLGRSGSRGICIFASLRLQTTEVSFPGCHFKEQLWIKIPLQGPDQLLIGCIYRSPSSNGHLSIKNLIELLQASSSSAFSHIVVAGDVNMPQIDWVDSFSHASDGHYTHSFIEGLHECGLTQHVMNATRFRQGVSPSTLDIILSNEIGLIQNLVYLPPIGNSDHVVLQFDISCYVHSTEPSRVRLNYNKGNFHHLNEMIRDTKWDFAESANMEQHYVSFRDTLSQITTSCIPPACPKNRRRNIYINREAMRLKKRKRKLWTVYVHSQDDISYARFVRCKNDLRRLTRTLRRDFEKNLIANIKENPKGFWNYARSRMKTRPGVENLRMEDGKLTACDEEKAVVLNQFFSSVCTLEDQHKDTDPEIVYDGPMIEDVDITVSVVKKKLSELRPSSAAGPDGIHPRVLQEAADSLAPQLSRLFRESLDTGILPQDWKVANVVPIFKKGNKDDPGNYRPVSLTSIPCKVIESILRDQLMTHLQAGNLLADAQHGFRPGRSCATQLLLAVEEWSALVERGEPVDILYLDLAKAFNTVPPRKLLQKVKAHGIDGKILRWIEAFLIGRQQRVIVGDKLSGWTPVPSGVPQGSVLAPLLFILYINDLPSILNCGIKIFADDSKLYRSVCHQGDALALQKDLDTTTRWADEWQLSFNATKCKVLHVGHQNRHNIYTLKGIMMEEVTVEKDLGIHIDMDLKFRKQAAAAVAKASQVMAVIRRSFQILDKSTLPVLYKTLVRPHLEYGNIIWGPFNRADQQLVERVQRRATKMVPELRHLSYSERLQELNLPSLYHRRRRGDMIMVYQLLHGGIDLDPQDFFTAGISRSTRGHAWRLIKPRAITRIRRNAFSVRVINDWNGLPPAVVSAETLNQFKNRLDRHWTHIAYTIPHEDG